MPPAGNPNKALVMLGHEMRRAELSSAARVNCGPKRQPIFDHMHSSPYGNASNELCQGDVIGARCGRLVA
jgi:hypothetical protein